MVLLVISTEKNVIQDMSKFYILFGVFYFIFFFIYLYFALKNHAQ